MKKKKLKKMLKKTREMVDAQSVTIDMLENRTSEILLIRERVDKLSSRLDKVEYSSSSAAMGEEIKDIKNQIAILRDRTNVDYSGMSKGNYKLSSDKIHVICSSCKHAAKKMSEHPCDTCCLDNHWEAKEDG